MSSVNDFARSENTYRGKKYVLEEADVATYDRCLKKATKTEVDPDTGRDAEEVDENLLLRLLLKECMIEPKGLDFSTVGLRLMRQLERDIRDLHFSVEPTTKTEKAKKDEPVEDDESPNDVS